MTVFESSSLERNFDLLIEDLNKMKEIASNKFKKLEESTGLTKIQHLQKLRLESFSVRLATKHDGWSNDKPILRVEWNGYDIDKFIEENCLAKGIHFERNWHYVYIYFKEDSTDSLENMVTFIEAMAQADKETHKQNVEKVRINQTTEKRLFDILEQVGISSTYYGYKTSRSRDTTKMYYSFPSEIRKQIPTNYSETRLDDLRKSLIDKVKKIWNDETYKMKQKRMEKEKAEKEKEQNKKLALLLAKYDLELTDSWEDLEDVIINKNKYLRLAYYLEKNRNDWTSGYDYAESGLSCFRAESEIDHKIEEDIESYMYDNWGGDGRVFRDCTYNYSVLYHMAAEQDLQLYKDFEVVKQNIEQF